ncbi:NAD(P)H-dependent glycerol-3-phosphate dehydrogenase [Phaeodactylibacter luteus]|uniref:Glycerol-3-phosphate dehydrogenase [NAD(P)+] n=1 Tax=Phaeodactylibacter luteus TaxID=1564516 RepID=A0A5C6S6V2_9BACT|nr:NAD(P)H-dependent glycerol-3-phosphate dehydrogenase [Phaeodactylibacter luteus]TXB69552.1 NAD(P)-dependent glycerol-3-phosphate dehydrogenase [Phaeodactylibacter luteus]
MPESSERPPVGVIGAGSFGTAIANLLAYNTDVLLYSRQPQLVAAINANRQHLGVALSPRVQATNSLEEVARNCTLLFPVVPSSNFRSMMRDLGPFLRPYHIMIHGTKGFDAPEDIVADPQIPLTRKDVSTMSEIIRQESVVLRVGCLSGPNLASEIMEGQPTATVIGSAYDEVISLGKSVLSSEHFHVFGTYDLLGAELAGALKNIIAIGSGILKGKGLGKNIQAMLITRGLTEMVYFGNAMGSSSSAFFGTAGIGDLVATATSKNSRNYTFGYRLGQGEAIADIENSMPELAEGVRTLRVARKLARYYHLRVPITDMLYKIVFEEFDIDRAISFLITYPYDVDVDFI